ncbi:hypothetical protein [uncultured Jannaschia sp.]|uniref:hypothetical protein n=1 Tax=uncultured Jannaschia sp. TaxID=293347 RepID=UPI0026072C6C|nr:hypothetical protein [uncultured Jannaschia sp.]
MTLFFLWSLPIGYCPNPPCNNQEIPHQGEQKRQGWLPVPWEPNSTIDTEPELSESTPTRSEYNALIAQENMARSTSIIAWATVGTVITSIVGIGFLVANLRAVSEANNISGRIQRPWVALDAEIVSDLNFNHDGARLILVFRALNHGELPAQQVRIRASLSCSQEDSMLAMRELLDYAEDSKSLSNAVKSHALTATGTILFPQQTVDVECGLLCPQYQIDRRAALWKTQNPNSSITPLSPFVSAIVSYRTFQGEETFVTTMNAPLTKVDPIRPDLNLSIDANDGQIPVERLALLSWLGSAEIR